MENSYRLNIEQIQRFLPHRSPFLLVDRILEIHTIGNYADEPFPYAPVGTKVVGIKNVSFNEAYFQGHFPSFPILPGVLIIETMAQVASFSVYPNILKDIDRLSREFQCILLGVDGARFRKPVVPGDTLRVETEVVKCRGKLWAFQCTAFVDGQKVAEAEVLANLTINSSQESR
jgi:3-hydroxyacyl-[acyl-carrier-protein] dehydratase